MGREIKVLDDQMHGGHHRNRNRASIWSWTQIYTASRCCSSLDNMFPFLPPPRNMRFPCLQPAELEFSRTYHLMAKFRHIITLCSLCQSTYITRNQSAYFFPILPPTLPWGRRNRDGSCWLFPAVPEMTAASSQKDVAQILSQRKHQAWST